MGMGKVTENWGQIQGVHGPLREHKTHTFLSLSYSISSGLCRWIRALKARPSFQLEMERQRL